MIEKSREELLDLFPQPIVLVSEGGGDRVGLELREVLANALRFMLRLLVGERADLRRVVQGLDH